MITAFHIRPITKEELPQIYTLEEAAFAPQHYPLFVLRQYYDVFADLFFVAVNQQQHIAGYCFGGIDLPNNLGWIFTVAVVPEQQQQGIGKQLTLHLMEAFKDRGITAVQLTTTTDNHTAIRLYEALGFREVSTTHYYFDAIPRLLMRCQLDKLK